MVTSSELRQSLRPYKTKSNVLGIGMFAVDVVCFAFLTTVAAVHPLLAVRVLAGALAGFSIGFLFVIGHEAAHGSLVQGRSLNRWIARISFLATATPLSTWELVHNYTHHVYTNLAPKDYVWYPLSLAEYRALPGWYRWVQRIYRTPLGLACYYPVEIWWKRLFFPAQRWAGKVERKYIVDSLFCSVWLIIQFILVARFGWGAVLTAIVWPQIVWSWLIGWALFDQHTHPQVPWFNDEAEWRRSQPQTRSSVHVTLPAPVDFVLHHVFNHTAHHLDMTIPIYRLAKAQREVEQLCGHVVVNRWTLQGFLSHLRSCKLYDFEGHHWSDFHGDRTSSAWTLE